MKNSSVILNLARFIHTLSSDMIEHCERNPDLAPMVFRDATDRMSEAIKRMVAVVRASGHEERTDSLGD